MIENTLLYTDYRRDLHTNEIIGEQVSFRTNISPTTPAYIPLPEIPDQFNRVKIYVLDGSEIIETLVEVLNYKDIQNNRTFYVDYEKCKVYFDDDMVGKTIMVKMVGQGNMRIDKELVSTERDANGDCKETLADIINNYREYFDGANTVGTVVEVDAMLNATVNRAEALQEEINVSVSEIEEKTNACMTAVSEKVDWANNKIENTVNAGVTEITDIADDAKATVAETKASALSEIETNKTVAVDNINATLNNALAEINTTTDSCKADLDAKVVASNSSVDTKVTEATTILDNKISQCNTTKTTIETTTSTCKTEINKAKTTALSEIQAKADECTDAQASARLDVLESVTYGCDNLVKTSFIDGFGNWKGYSANISVVDVIPVPDCKSGKALKVNTTASYGGINMSYSETIKVLKPSTTYTFSAFIKGGADSIIRLGCQSSSTDGNNFKEFTITNNDWIKCEWTFKTVDTLPSNCQLYIYSAVPQTLHIHSIKLEKGSKSTDVSLGYREIIDLIQYYNLESLKNEYRVGGKLYISMDSTNPEEILGFGTWTLVSKGRMLMGVDPDSSEFSSSGLSGGRSSVTLNISNLPPHDHEQFVTANNGGSINGRADYNTDATNNNKYTQGIRTGLTGSGTAFNILPPYVTAYIWQRTA